MALRTNTKKAKANLWQYIKEATAGHIEEMADYDRGALDCFLSTGCTRSQLAGFIWDSFNIEALRFHKGFEAGRVSMYEVFEEWAQGVPCGGLFDYYLDNNAITIAGDILEETEEERARFTESQAGKFLTRYIYDAIRKELDRY